MSAYEYRLTAAPIHDGDGGWVVKIWLREFHEDPDQTAWKCVYEQTKKRKTDGRFPALYWKWIVQQTIA